MARAHSIIRNDQGESKSWRRADIFWSDADDHNWNIDKYYAPHYTLLETDGVLQRANKALNLRKDKQKATSQVVDYAENDYAVQKFEGSARAPIEAMLKDAARIHAQGRSDAVVCTQVSQWVIIQVKTFHEIIDGDFNTFPNVHIWGFLQPASIGGDAKRREREKGWVTDDIPRAGWFEAKVVWSQRGEESRVFGTTPAFVRLQPEDIGSKIVDAVYCSDPKPESVKKSIPYRLIKNDDGTCTTIQIKVKAVIRNDETREDRERKFEKLKSEVKQALSKKGKDSETIEKIIASIDRYEAGSFLKIWVRNLDYCWSPPPTAGHVADDESERCMHAMQLLDSPGGKSAQYTFQNYNNTPPKDQEDTYFRPFSFRNHVWKRNKVVINPWGEGVGSQEAYDRELVYILLLPTEVLEKIDKLFTDKQVEKAAKDPENSWLMPLSVCISFFVLLSILRKIKAGARDADKFQKTIDALSLPKHAAIMASMKPARDAGQFVKNFQNPKRHQVFAGDPGAGHFSDGRQKLCQFFAVLFTQAYAIALTQSDEEYNSFVEGYQQRQATFWNSKNSDEISRTLGFGESEEKLIALNYVFKEVEKIKKLGGSKLPGYFCWLEWAVLLKLGFSLGAQVTFGRKPEDDKKERYYLNGSLDPKGLVSLAVELGAIWSMVNQEKQQASSKEAWEWAETIKYVLTWVELKLGISLSLKSEGKIGFDVDFLSVAGEKIKAMFNPDLKIDHTLSLDSQIYATVSNLVQLDYSALHYTIMHLTNSGISIGDALYIGGKPVAGVKPFSYVWGKVEAQYEQAKFVKDKTYLGSTVSVYANYRGQPDPSHYSLDICAQLNTFAADNYQWTPIFCDEMKRERSDSLEEDTEFKDRISVTNRLLIDDTFYCDDPKKRFLKKLLQGDQKLSGVIYLNDQKYKDDITKGKTDKAKSVCIMLSPHVSVSVPSDFALNDTIKIAAMIHNFACDVPVYLWVYEDDDYCVYTGEGRRNCMKVTTLKASNDHCAGYVTVPLGKFKIMANVRNELTYKVPLLAKQANISFRFSLDPEGELMFMSEDKHGKRVDAAVTRDVTAR